MPVTFDYLVKQAQEALGENLLAVLNLRDDHLADVVGRIVKSTIAGCGLYVMNTGEVGDPRPKPETVFQYSRAPSPKRRR